jgi:hypothetical protein
MKKTISIAAVFAAATLLAAGLVMLPGSVQEVQANPCSIQANGPGGVHTHPSGSGEVNTDYNCDFEGIGSLELTETE